MLNVKVITRRFSQFTGVGHSNKDIFTVFEASRTEFLDGELKGMVDRPKVTLTFSGPTIKKPIEIELDSIDRFLGLADVMSQMARTIRKESIVP